MIVEGINTNWSVDGVDDNTHPFVNCFRSCKVDHLRFHNPFESIILLKGLFTYYVSPPCKGWSRHRASHTCRSQNHWLARGVPNPGIICWYWIHKYKYKCIIPTFSSYLSYFYIHDDIHTDVHEMWTKKYLVVFQEVVQPSRKSNLTFVKAWWFFLKKDQEMVTLIWRNSFNHPDILYHLVLSRLDDDDHWSYNCNEDNEHDIDNDHHLIRDIYDDDDEMDDDDSIEHLMIYWWWWWDKWSLIND